MSLRNPKTATAAFEAEDQAVATGTAAPSETLTAETKRVEAPVVAANEEKHVPAAPVKGGAVVSAAKYRPALEEFHNQIDPASLDFDTFRRITVGLGGFSDEAKTKVGARLKVELMSYNDRFVVSPGVKNTEADEKVKFSLDGVHLDDGSGLVADYLKELKEVDGYDEASVKKYLNIYGFLVATSKTEDSEFVEIAPEDREIVSIQVPPRSYAKFTRLQLEMGVKVAQGIVPATNVIEIGFKSVAGKSTEYAEYTFKRG